SRAIQQRDMVFSRTVCDGRPTTRQPHPSQEKCKPDSKMAASIDDMRFQARARGRYNARPNASPDDAMLRIVATFCLLALLLAGCGQKGPLYLPQPDEAGATQTAE